MTRTSNRGVWMFDRCRPLWLALSVACTAAPAWAQTSPPTAPPTAGTSPPAAAAPALPAPPSSQDKMQRLSDEARIKHEAGLMICRYSADNKLIYEGFVQSSENGFLKIEIGAAIDRASAKPVPKFETVDVWDSVDNWWICTR
ncbi:hypothetical protein [Solimonas marina]|uniref:DUF2155 domain-containing protein n=1 Tax=Solimonas marina TaxID=2714601 RepID=A0A969WB93_9GAMM|nr:hypothetical protein [Solimonas marina]NKF23368.1 hypothetical protein [Solimonas marina]